jgi:hypothetical protein
MLASVKASASAKAIAPAKVALAATSAKNRNCAAINIASPVTKRPRARSSCKRRSTSQAVKGTGNTSATSRCVSNAATM